MTVLDRPWARVKQPTVIPSEVDHDLVAALPVEELAALVRDHLVPSGPSGPERQAWDRFWGVLREDDELAGRTFDVLEEFLDDTEDALEDVDDGDQQRKRMQKFLMNAQNAWARLQKDPTLVRTVPAGQRRLLAAIAEHRSAVLSAGVDREAADSRLWRVLDDVGADSAGFRRPR